MDQSQIMRASILNHRALATVLGLLIQPKIQPTVFLALLHQRTVRSLSSGENLFLGLRIVAASNRQVNRGKPEFQSLPQARS